MPTPSSPPPPPPCFPPACLFVRLSVCLRVCAEGRQRDPTEMAQQILELLDGMGYLRWVPACDSLPCDSAPGL